MIISIDIKKVFDKINNHQLLKQWTNQKKINFLSLVKDIKKNTRGGIFNNQ